MEETQRLRQTRRWSRGRDADTQEDGEDAEKQTYRKMEGTQRRRDSDTQEDGAEAETQFSQIPVANR
jgi:hypothetical protein